ncbi:RdgB/HAM1 family non-canonical purine NTP pyrophosphatase [Shewanella sp. DNRA4]|uniref:dITP/XTP pyrophosphatase n=1 Tax=Shewanella xiamenensis TaxID=332186 RepID=A0AAW6QV08_9GAMM|nr:MULTISPECIES: RdgB/HAM1 family non-canonical purine NTP pyrophosphatase [Shewanella]MDG5899271.1 RdgB/HAM1 family non-canonical purine NTP pyrophosphatase [Shewanella xiamenensis]MDI5831085.1 RdgB/HAM1 family non-canonical purine NTP pyrophosphatase [Shewanella xiamenensis]NMD52131.1 RdgB/HAM1 family non-canonical purine NTP pyrophosphatase [Shewanella sp. DNRA4]TVL33512.1 non-canonical purine NTP pyrophosphatase [Shewanella xiamenensis]UML94898.1 RdgB/HAM1 family non-canonical purine NTP p
MQQIVLASGNKGKLAEFDQMLAAYGVKVLPQSQFNVSEVAETGTTFVENAIIKARHAAQITGLAAIADDSGLEVDLLQGAPGIYSARYAGENAKDQDNVLKLLDTLKDNPAPRTARFQCVLVYMRHAKDPTPIICQAAWEGQIDFVQRGDNGHGYDPIFIPEHHDCSAAQMSSDEKNALSHRGKALVQLIAAMQAKGVFTDGNAQ